MKKSDFMKLVYVLIALMGLMQSALLASLPWLIENSPLDSRHWSWLVAGGMLGFVVFAPVWGRAVDTYGPWRILVTCFAGFTVAHGVFLVALWEDVYRQEYLISIGLLVFSRVVYAVFTSGLFGAAQAELLWQKQDKIKSSLARLNAVSQFGRLLGPVVILAASAIHAIAGIYVLVAVSILLTTFLLIKKQHFLSRPGEALVASKEGPSGQQTVSFKRFWPEFSAAFALTFSVGLLQFSLGPFVQSSFQVDAGEATKIVSIMLSLSAMVVIFCSFVIVPKLERFDLAYLVLMLVSLASGSGLLVWMENIWIGCLGVALFSVGVACCSPYYGHRIRSVCPDQQGRVGGLLTSIHTFGYAAGIFLGGYLLFSAPEFPLWPLIFTAPLIGVLISRLIKASSVA